MSENFRDEKILNGKMDAKERENFSYMKFIRKLQIALDDKKMFLKL